MTDFGDSGFVPRHIGPMPAEIDDMLHTVGAASLEALIERAVPAVIRSREPLPLPPSRSEADVLAELRAMAEENRVLRSMIGLGYYDCVTPPVILRNVFENPGWYTAYTPYQPEISQGRLEALLNFQTMVADLTGMDLANASLLDEGTAAAEAMTLCHAANKRSRSNRFVIAADCFPQTIAVVETRARPLGIEVVVGEVERTLAEGDAFGVLLQYPAADGTVHDLAPPIALAHQKGALAVVAADLLALVMLPPPGAFGADVAIGSAQRFGVPLGFGGPHAAYFATRDAHKRSMPGRLVGVSVDRRGRPACRLALQTREQHIRREKATSNICTAQVLLAVMAGFYAVYHGPEGLRRIAERVHRLTAIMRGGLERLGFAARNATFFDTLTIACPAQAATIAARAEAAGVNLRVVSADAIGVALDETTTPGDVETVWRAFAPEAGAALRVATLRPAAEGIPVALRREGAILRHPVFSRYHSETEMMRYLRKLADRDVALDRSMIPLGSCTMKLNAAAEMIPVTWREFGAIHPFAPIEQARGYLRLIRGLEAQLTAITGFAAVSLQPNAGSQGEYAGLLCIRAYHAAHGQEHRRVCLIPSSAHGTNPASAVMAGCTVVVVGCDENGNIDIADLRAKAEAHRTDLAALMVTYPSTHGVFEEGIRAICDIVHGCGGQVYMDGANLNALVGIARPGAFGPDVMHINLHKTFCIPHGGGGPGVGPIGVREHLAPFLPNHPLRPEAGPASGVGPVAAAPWGSASILPISWAYIALMGGAGLTRATAVAVLSANYVAARLKACFPVLYTGTNGLVAHECILDVRPLQEATGVTVEDVAKRLMDYGFHAPTMSWPVAGTLMVEPTESESLYELDRFCTAMIAIHSEVMRVADGRWSREDNPLKFAPHTSDDLVDAEWTHGYTRQEAVFPVPELRANKYWPPVSRIDQAHGDRNLVCSCPPLEAYRSAAE
ncbi:MAG: aminomethyl-transferring glycine dehydrogenase [Alphaproteobacteria bacterium]|nr:aminomethyl-transferring glycine dehydrogenase [Alphaproteobacteria bacterium]